MKQRFFRLVPFVLLAFCLGKTLGAAQIEGVEFKELCNVGEHGLALNNVALMRYKIVIKALVAGLYLGDGIKPRDVLTDVPKRLELHYFWDLEGKEIVKAANKILADNLTPSELEKQRKNIDKMNKLFQDVKAGDRYTLTYIPGVGTELALNGEKKGVVGEASFAAAYFTIWLGKKPMDVALRDTLLKNR